MSYLYYAAAGALFTYLLQGDTKSALGLFIILLIGFIADSFSGKIK